MFHLFAAHQFEHIQNLEQNDLTHSSCFWKCYLYVWVVYMTFIRLHFTKLHKHLVNCLIIIIKIIYSRLNLYSAF
jgi:uncharacterized metal-binding protein